eukprot:g18025.t1
MEPVEVHLRRQGYTVLRQIGKGSFGSVFLCRKMGGSAGTSSSSSSRSSSTSTPRGPPSELVVCKMIDVSNMSNKEKEDTLEEVSKCLSSTLGHCMTQIGTPYYISPEIASHKEYSFNSDVWSLGCLAYELLVLKVPYDAPDVHGLCRKIREYPMPALPTVYSAELRKTIARMFEKNPKLRPGSDDLLKAPVFVAEIKSMRASGLPTGLPEHGEEHEDKENYCITVGDSVEYWSDTHQQYVRCRVTHLNKSTGDFIVDAKPGTWLRADVRKRKVRLLLHIKSAPQGHDGGRGNANAAGRAGAVDVGGVAGDDRGGDEKSTSEAGGGGAAQKSSNKALLENLLFPVGLLLTDCGSWINSMGLFGFLFHVPGHNGLLLSLSNSCYYIAAFLPVVLQTLLMDRGYSFPDALLLYCVPVSVAMVGGYFVIPAQNEYYKQATEVLTMPIPRPRPSSNWKAWGKKMRHTIAMIRCLVGTSDGRRLTKCIFVYISLPDPYVVALFHGNTAIGSEIAAYVVTSLAWMGLVVSPVVGVLIDYRTLVYGDGDGNGSNSETRQREKHNHLGFKLVILLCCASLLVVGCFCLVPNLEAQKVVVTAVNLVQVSTNTIMMRYILLFTPANRVGTVSGAFLASLGFFAVFGILGMSVAVNDQLEGSSSSYPHGVAKEDGVYTRLKADVVAWQNSGSKSNVLPPSVASYVESTTAEDEDHHQVMTAKGSLVERESFLVDLVMRRLDSAKAVIHDEECTLTALKYAVPTIFTVLLAICAFGVFLADMNSRGDYLPSEPPLLPEDELEVCRRFGVASVEDAAFVLGVDRGEVLRLCASGNVLDMRRLVQLMAKSGPRLVELAKKKTLTINRNDDFGYSELPGGAGSCDGIEDVDAELVAPLPSRRLSAAPEEVVKLIVDSFWPAEEAGYKGSPLLDWLSFSGRRGASLRRSSLVSRGDVVVEEDEQVDRLHKLLAYQNAITYHIAARYGHVLELSTTTGVGEDDENPPDTVENNDKDNTKIITSKDKEDKVKANCGENKNKLCCGLLCLPPGRFPTVGSSEYYYGLAKAGVPFPGYPSAEMMERDMALSAVLEGGGSPEHDRRALPPHYYVASLATCGDARGRGLAKILLDVVKKRGQRCTRW